MKKILILISLIITISSTYATPGRLSSSGCHNSSTDGYHCHDSKGNIIKEKTKEDIIEEKEKPKLSSKFQTKADEISARLIIINKKNPKTIERLATKFTAFKSRFKEGTDIYLLVETIETKLLDLLEENKKKLENNSNNELTKKNTFNDSFSKAKKYLEQNVYNNTTLTQNTFYCGCDYSSDKYVNKESCGFQDNGKYVTRSKKIEWEHVVPAEAFGQSFKEWRDGASECVDSKGKSFSGRNCASKVNMEYRYMQADMYNLVPAIGSINGLRSNYSFAEISGEKREFGTCNMEIGGGKEEPREEVKGDIARIYMYMNATYPGKGVISSKNKKLFDIWSKNDPVSEEECEKYRKIREIQGNENGILKELCIFINK